MQWLVEVRDGAGNIKWVTVTAANADDARTVGTQNNWIADSNVWRAGQIPADVLAMVEKVAGVGADINDFPTFGSLGIGQVGGGGTGGTGGFSNISGGAEAQFGPLFRAGLADRNITLGGGGGIEGRLAEQARDPFYSRSLASAAFADPSATEVTALPSFQEMVRTGDLYGGGGAQKARDLLTQAQGFGTEFTNRGALAGSILNPSTVSEGTNLANIAREAGRQRFGSFARFLPQAGSLSEGFFAQPQQGAQTFADFLSQKIFGG